MPGDSGCCWGSGKQVKPLAGGATVLTPCRPPCRSHAGQLDSPVLENGSFQVACVFSLPTESVLTPIFFSALACLMLEGKEMNAGNGSSVLMVRMEFTFFYKM